MVIRELDIRHFLTPRSSSGPGRRPLTAVTRVRLPYGVLIDSSSAIPIWMGPGFSASIVHAAALICGNYGTGLLSAPT
jgi:hypothetical protein